MLGDYPHTSVGPWRAESGGDGSPRPQVEVYTTQYGDVMHRVVHPTIYETVQALGYRDLYTANHQVKGERTLKERARTCKGILGLRTWLARHSAVLAPLLRAPMPRWQAAPKD